MPFGIGGSGPTITVRARIYQSQRDELKRLGIKFGDDIPQMSTSVEMTLPKGWVMTPLVQGEPRAQATITDRKGNVRALISRRHHSDEVLTTVNRRYSIEYDDPTSRCVSAVVMDGNKELFRTGSKTYDGMTAPDVYGWVQYEAKQWLNKHFPKWEDPNAYW